MSSASEQHERHPWVERLARFGYAAKGAVYLLVGLLAARAALGPSSTITSKIGVLQMIVAQPLGTLLLGAVTVGLAGYVLWRLVQAIVDPPKKGADPQGIARRLGYAANGLVYAGLAYAGIEILTGSSVADNARAAETWTARLLTWPFGRWLVAAAGLVVIGYGLYELYRAYSASFREHLELNRHLSDGGRAWVMGISRFGLAARGLVLSLIGIFLIQAALRHEAREAGGLRAALDTVASGPFGSWVLGIVAAGLIAYGLYCLIEAGFRRIPL